MNDSSSNPPPPAPSPDALWMDAREWRDPTGFAEFFHREFPAGASEWDRRLSRRRFVQLMGASLALAGLPGCRMPQQKIVPYTDQPEKVIPGNSLHFATTLQVNGHPRGVVVTSHEGRPTHIAGNPLHPLSLGANDIWTGAAILELYDPDRLQTPLFKGEPASWDAFMQTATQLSSDWAQSQGAGVAILTGPVNSPTLLNQLRQFLARFPQAKWYQHEPLGMLEIGTFGTPAASSVGDLSYASFGSTPLSSLQLEPSLDLASADVIFSLESDFLFDRPDSLALTRAFSKRRQTDTQAKCNRLYVAESSPTITGAKADHRFIVSPGDFTALATALLTAVESSEAPADPRWPWLAALADDLRSHAGRCVLIGGRALPLAAQLLLMAANSRFKPAGVAPHGFPTPATVPSPLAQLVGRMRQGEVTALVMLGVNPVYDAPADFNFADLLDAVPTTIHHTLHANETSAHCDRVVHAAHDLEAWGDARAIDGTVSICQPLIAPLYDGKSALELVSLLVQAPATPGYDLVRQTWMTLTKSSPAPAPVVSPGLAQASPPVASSPAQSAPNHQQNAPALVTPSVAPNPAESTQAVPGPVDPFEAQWHRWLRDGVIPSSVSVSLSKDQPPADSHEAGAGSESSTPPKRGTDAVEIITGHPAPGDLPRNHDVSGLLPAVAQEETGSRSILPSPSQPPVSAPDGRSGDAVALTPQATGTDSANSTVASQQKTPASQAPPAPPAIYLTFRPSPALWDGRYANNPWLQELADPITKLTWDNAALFSPATAKRLNVTDGDIVKITARGVSIEAPVLIAPGQSDAAITLPLGYGRIAAGSVGTGVGFNAYLLRHSDAPWQVIPDDIEKTGRTHPLARTQEHFRVAGRDLLHVTRIDEHPPAQIPGPKEPPLPTLYPKVDYSQGHAWAMTIDLNTCIGCNACIIACQSENNIPVVGKDQVLFGREMQWIRVDRYYQGAEDNPRAHFQPVPCMQCENAPCEVVCPVAATQHDDEGLNVMVYNRCVGTRYCSNNCPYKVRRFNFLFYNDGIPESRTLQLNPNVTVRSRGVMEKCTYCVQRIEEARIASRREHRPLRGTDIITACQAACPAEAIVFGDLNDPESVVTKNRQKPGHYGMLAELDTRPRTTYLEKKINPNPVIEPRAAI